MDCLHSNHGMKKIVIQLWRTSTRPLPAGNLGRASFRHTLWGNSHARCDRL